MVNIIVTKPLGKRLKFLRMQAGFTEVEICEKLQMNAGKFSKLENGMTTIPLWRLVEIAEFFKVDIHYLLIRKDFPSIPELTEEVESLARINLLQAKEITRLQRKVIELYSNLGPDCRRG